MNNFSGSAYKLVKGMGKTESITSYLGLLYHFDSGRVIDKIFTKVGWGYNW